MSYTSNCCVACGAKYNGMNHKCDHAVEAKIEAGRNAHNDRDIYPPPRTFHERLCEARDLMKFGGHADGWDWDTEDLI